MKRYLEMTVCYIHESSSLPQENRDRLPLLERVLTLGAAIQRIEGQCKRAGLLICYLTRRITYIRSSCVSCDSDVERNFSSLPFWSAQSGLPSPGEKIFL